MGAKERVGLRGHTGTRTFRDPEKGESHQCRPITTVSATFQ